ncbi:hypothetical protein [Polymorphospora rubra]|uniref:hypothetical protein n=1 Tax=Polymorphospora rubra TaxID=338584 RepID=UPI0033D54CB9
MRILRRSAITLTSRPTASFNVCVVKKALQIWFWAIVVGGLVGGKDGIEAMLCLGLVIGGFWLFAELDDSGSSGGDKWSAGSGGAGAGGEGSSGCGGGGCGGGCGGGD